MSVFIKRSTCDWDKGEVTLEFGDKRRKPMTLSVRQLAAVVEYYENPKQSTTYQFMGVGR